jgi:opacity protein-like surface antigen
MRTRLVFGLAILCLALAVPTAWAQTSTPQTQSQSSTNDKDSFRDYLAPYIGFDTGGSLFKAADAPAALKGLDPGNPRVYGIAVGFWGKGMLSGELDFAYHKDFFGPEGSPFIFTNQTGAIGSNNLMTITASFVINPSIDIGSQRIRPYVLVGGGLMRSTISGFGNLGGNVDNRGIVNIGGGLQYYFHKRVGVRADFRYNIGVGAETSGSGWGWMNTWNFYRFVIGPAFTF